MLLSYARCGAAQISMVHTCCTGLFSPKSASIFRLKSVNPNNRYYAADLALLHPLTKSFEMTAEDGCGFFGREQFNYF